ncbi:MAG: hypothetical protein ACXABY_21265 [Candidatus Thorarchaeota archaeon]|jgi:hypothetical protein
MAKQEVATTLPAATPAQIAKNDGKGWDERAITVEFDFSCDEGEDPNSVWGEPVVKFFTKKAGVVDLQGKVRRMLKAGKSDGDIIKWVNDEYKLAIPTSTRKSPSEKMADLFKGMSKEQKIAAIKSLRESAGV